MTLSSNLAPALGKATVRAGSNIAFIKYWGVADARINLPLNNSISMTLADAYTLTTVAWDDVGHLTHDEVVLDDQLLAPVAAARISRHLDRLRDLAGVTVRARVVSRNNFPTASGIASSASGFSALTVAGCAALGLNLEPAALSALSRLASGSASRSHFGGFVEWVQGTDHANSVAQELYGPEHWDLVDLVAVVSDAAKRVSSEAGHTIAASSPLQSGRIASLPPALESVRQAIAHRDLAAMGPILEQDALAMHGVMMTGNPSLLYWQPGTLQILHAVRRWREEEGVPVYFTIDAGPNVHLICEGSQVVAVQTRLAQLSAVQQIIASRPGPAPLLLDEHLF